MISTDSTQPPVIECIGLTKVFQDFWGRDKVLAVDRLDLDVRPGEVFGLLGPNGSGKSTTIKILLGLLYPTTGVARVFGRPPTDTAIKARIGFMPEESYLYSYLNAYETLDYYGRLFRLDRVERRRRTEQLIEMVGLKRAGRRPVGTYSKGMARRIGLAQAIINDPDMLILDEPTTGLDPVGTHQIKDLIRILGDRGKTVLLCSHLLADVEDVCDRVAVMYGGRRMALGAVGDLLERRDVTQITARRLEQATIDSIRAVIAKSGGQTIAVEHPTDRLEAFFLDIVSQAQREKLQTSGAESTVEVSAFLRGRPGDQESLIESLVEAGKHQRAAPEPAARNPVAESPPLKKELIEKLKSGDRPFGAPPPGDDPGPVESSTPTHQPDRAVLDRLLKKTSEQSAAGTPPSGDDGS